MERPFSRGPRCILRFLAAVHSLRLCVAWRGDCRQQGPCSRLAGRWNSHPGRVCPDHRRARRTRSQRYATSNDEVRDGYRGRGHSSLRGAPPHRSHRRPGLEAAHRPQPQRADRHRPAPIHPFPHRYAAGAPWSVGRATRRTGESRGRRGDAVVYPSAARRARAGGPLAARLRRNAAPRCVASCRTVRHG